MSERSVPQHIQQLVIRDYCQRNGLHFLLSATEYVMEDSTLMLEAVLQEDIEGIVFYSLFQLSDIKYTRMGKPIHFAAENLKVTNDQECKKIKDILLCMKLTS